MCRVSRICDHNILFGPDLFCFDQHIGLHSVRFAGGDGGDHPPLWFTRPTLCWIIFILGGDKNYPPHPKYFHHYIVIINNQNTQGPSSFWLCCDFDLPGASQRRRAWAQAGWQRDNLCRRRSKSIKLAIWWRRAHPLRRWKTSRHTQNSCCWGRNQSHTPEGVRWV